MGYSTGYIFTDWGGEKLRLNTYLMNYFMDNAKSKWEYQSVSGNTIKSAKGKGWEGFRNIQNFKQTAIV